MEQNQPDLKSDGTTLVLSLIQNLLDPESPPPNLPQSTRNAKTVPQPKDIDHLATQMAQITRGKVSEQITQLQRQMFLLTNGQLRTLDTLDVPIETHQAIRKLNGMVKIMENHAINIRLEVIGQIPPTPKNREKPDWETWWFDHRDSHMGIHRPQDHDPVQDPISATLNTVIAQIAHRAVRHLPDHQSIADRLRAQPDRKKQTPLSLSEVWTTAVKIRKLSYLLGLNDQDIIKNWERTLQDLSHSNPLAPDRILAEVPGLVADMGSITDLVTLKTKLPAQGTGAVLPNTDQAIWYQKDIRDSHLMGPLQTSSRVFYDNPDEAPPTTSNAEREFIHLTTPLHPREAQTLIYTQDRAAQAIAFINKNTPRATRDYLNGDSDDPTPPNPDPCPMASQCPTDCGRLQASGEFPFPLNDDGDYRKCQYWQFIDQHQHSDPVIRELAATKRVQEERDRQDQTFRTQNRQDGAPRPTPGATPNAPAKDPPKAAPPDQTKQASLF